MNPVKLMLSRGKGLNLPSENANSTISKGNGGIPASLKVKAAGTTPDPTPIAKDANRVKVEKTSNLF